MRNIQKRNKKAGVAKKRYVLSNSKTSVSFQLLWVRLVETGQTPFI